MSLKLQSLPRIGRATRQIVDSGVLGVSWLNGTFHASADASETPRAWSAPELILNVSAIGPAIREAIRQTGFAGHSVALVLAHPLLAQMFVELPISAPSVARRLLERHVERHKPFNGAAIWQAQWAASQTASPSCFVHMLPRELCDTLVNACRDEGLTLTRLIPVSELLENMIPVESSAAIRASVVAIEIPQAVLVAVNLAPGVPLLRRTVLGTWRDDQDRILGELKRTIIFLRQQYQCDVKSMWIGGADLPEDEVRAASLALSLDVRPLPLALGAEAWARLVLKPSLKAVNLLSREQREAGQRRVASRFGRTFGILALLAASGLAVFSERLRELENANHARLDRDVARAEQSLNSLKTADRAMRQQRMVVEMRERALGPPLQLWLLGCLANALPPGLLLTEVKLSRHSNDWKMNIRGSVTPPFPERSEQIVQRFAEAMALGPFAVNLAPPGTANSTNLMSPVTETSWARRLGQSTLPRIEAPLSFELEGTIQ